MTPQPAVEISGLTKTFEVTAGWTRLVRRSPRRHPIDALHDISASIPTGAVVALTGSNGAGKSTLLRILATLVSPSSGAAHVAGTPVTDDRARLLVSLAGNDERAFSHRLSGRENLEFFAALHGRSSADAAQALDRVGLTDAADDSFATYSTGMRQRLGVARALLPQAPILLLDEPFRALDDEGARRLRDALEGERARGATLVVATHHTDELAGLWTAELRLEAGRVVNYGEAS